MYMTAGLKTKAHEACSPNAGLKNQKKMLNSHQGRRGPTRRSGSTELIHSRCPASGRETQHFSKRNLQLLLAAEGEEEDAQTGFLL